MREEIVWVMSDPTVNYAGILVYPVCRRAYYFYHS